MEEKKEKKSRQKSQADKKQSKPITPPKADSLEENLRWLLGQPVTKEMDFQPLLEAGLKNGCWSLALALALVRKAAGGDVAALKEVRSLTQTEPSTAALCGGVQIIDDLSALPKKEADQVDR